VEASSEGDGLGSRFTFRLPLSVPDAQRPPEEAKDPAEIGRRRILLIEDNADARQMLHMLLTLAGHEVDSAADGSSGLEKAAVGHPDIAVIDLGLPGVDGYEVARRLRAGGRDDLGLIALTGYGQPADRQAALAAGFDAHVVKPVDPSHLASVIASVQRRRHPEREPNGGQGRD
jgi:DNA-binding response OmpR family regulator